MTVHMTTDAQTQAISRLPAAELAVADAEVAAATSEADDARTESVREMYEAGLAKLDALHDRWATAVAEIRGAQPGGDRRETAA